MRALLNWRASRITPAIFGPSSLGGFGGTYAHAANCRGVTSSLSSCVRGVTSRCVSTPLLDASCSVRGFNTCMWRSL